jgi:hypothetical protein
LRAFGGRGASGTVLSEGVVVGLGDDPVDGLDPDDAVVGRVSGVSEEPEQPASAAATSAAVTVAAGSRPRR